MNLPPGIGKEPQYGAMFGSVYTMMCFAPAAASSLLIPTCSRVAPTSFQSTWRPIQASSTFMLREFTQLWPALQTYFQSCRCVGPASRCGAVSSTLPRPPALTAPTAISAKVAAPNHPLRRPGTRND